MFLEEYSGELIQVLVQDSDPDASPTLRISAIQPSGGSSSSVSSVVYNSSGTSNRNIWYFQLEQMVYTGAANDSISGLMLMRL